jgi:hypothetical protein
MKRSRFVSPLIQNSEDLASSMAANLQNLTKNASKNELESGKGYLKEAQKILTSLGLKKSAFKISNLIEKMAQEKKHHAVMSLPSVAQLMEAGLEIKDFEKMNKGDIHSRAKINKTLWDLGLSQKEIIDSIGTKNFMRKEDANLFFNPTSSSSRILRMIQNPLSKNPNKIEEGDEISLHSVAEDSHTKGLSSEKQLKNLLDHGTQFNLADDRADLLELDVNDADLEVLEKELESELGFEDEI